MLGERAAEVDGLGHRPACLVLLHGVADDVRQPNRPHAAGVERCEVAERSVIRDEHVQLSIGRRVLFGEVGGDFPEGHLHVVGDLSPAGVDVEPLRGRAVLADGLFDVLDLGTVHAVEVLAHREGRVPHDDEIVVPVLQHVVRGLHGSRLVAAERSAQLHAGEMLFCACSELLQAEVRVSVLPLSIEESALAVPHDEELDCGNCHRNLNSL